MSDYEPSPELVEAMHSRGFYRADVYDHLRAAVAFRHPDGHPELVPWEQVRELVDAAQWATRPIGGSADALAQLHLDAHHRLRAALAPFTQEPEDA